jgi:hypothetical protein
MKLNSVQGSTVALALVATLLTVYLSVVALAAAYTAGTQRPTDPWGVFLGLLLFSIPVVVAWVSWKRATRRGEACARVARSVGGRTAIVSSILLVVVVLLAGPI